MGDDKAASKRTLITPQRTEKRIRWTKMKYPDWSGKARQEECGEKIMHKRSCGWWNVNNTFLEEDELGEWKRPRKWWRKRRCWWWNEKERDARRTTNEQRLKMSGEMKRWREKERERKNASAGKFGAELSPQVRSADQRTEHAHDKFLNQTIFA